MEISLSNIRITGQNKNYWLNKLQDFADSQDPEKYSQIEFGKQDIRGGISITWFDHRHCVPKQEFFKPKDMMLGFIQGWLK